jgi:carbon monoxide dehydrogenase subunit G
MALNLRNGLCVSLLAGLLSINSAMAVTESQLLKQGRVVLVPPAVAGKALAKDAPRQELTAKILINRPVEQVWKVISDQKLLFSGDSNIKMLRIVDKPSSTQEVVEYSLSLSKLLPAFHYTTKVDYRPQSTAHFKRVSGSFKDFDGLCRLAAFEKGQQTVLTYSLSLDPGIPLPKFMVHEFLKRDLPRMLTNIQGRVYKQFPAQAIKTAEKPAS